MRFLFSKPVWRAVRRRLCAGMTFLAYLAAAIGFPLPNADAKSPTGGVNQVCCCGTPIQCKASGCGCSHEPAPEPEPCCAKKLPTSCCVKGSTTTKPATESKSDSVRWVLGMSAKKCGGGLTDWVHADAALPMPTPLTWQPSWPYCHSLPITQEFTLSLSANPLDPPPRPDAV